MRIDCLKITVIFESDSLRRYLSTEEAAQVDFNPSLKISFSGKRYFGFKNYLHFSLISAESRIFYTLNLFKKMFFHFL
jgi:hypothetical protein